MAVSTIDNSGISASAAISTSKLGTGAVLQVLTVSSNQDSNITVTNSAGGQSALYGSGVGGRVYGDLTSLTITPTTATSKFIFWGSTGLSNGVLSTNGAFGTIFVVNNTTGVGFGSDYPWYSAGTTLGNNNGRPSNYAPPTMQHASYVPGSASAFTVYFKGYSYSEGATQTTNFRNAFLTVMEVAG